MHCDTILDIWRSRKEAEPVSLRRSHQHIDLEKLLKGDYLLQNFAMFVFLGDEDGDPLVTVNELIDEYYLQLALNKDLIAPVFRYEDIEKNAAAGKLSAMLTVEEGGVCKGNVSVLRNLYRLGVRMMTLTWNFENEIGFPHCAAQNGLVPQNSSYGLKPRGIEILREMNRLGMIVDVSHLSDDGFWDVVKYCDGPFVASHSNARAVCGHTRNLTDDMIRALADKGGVTGINFCGEFLAEDEKSTAEAMARHIKHIVNVGGMDCVGLGTDFDGIGGELELCDASCMPMLAREMEKQGFTENQIEKVFSGNVLRLYKDVLK